MKVLLPLAAFFVPLIAPAAPAPAQPVPDRLELKTAIAFALENNFAVRQARERVELTSARTSNHQANHGYNVALAQLRRATGFADIEYASAAAPAQPARIP